MARFSFLSLNVVNGKKGSVFQAGSPCNFGELVNYTRPRGLRKRWPDLCAISVAVLFHLVPVSPMKTSGQIISALIRYSPLPPGEIDLGLHLGPSQSQDRMLSRTWIAHHLRSTVCILTKFEPPCAKRYAHHRSHIEVDQPRPPCGGYQVVYL